MKVPAILIALVTLMFFSCSTENRQTDISGTYVTQFTNEYSATIDTLIIATTSDDKTYSIERLTGFNKIRNGQALPKGYKHVKWTSSYDRNKQILQETELGRQIHVLPEKGILTLGSSEYRRIK